MFDPGCTFNIALEGTWKFLWPQWCNKDSLLQYVLAYHLMTASAKSLQDSVADVVATGNRGHRLQPLAYRLPPHRESPTLRLTTAMCETEGVERFRFPFSAPLPTPGRDRPKFE